ncbi:tetratricopeptide repeat-containing sensor histidine kinase [Hyunsoonleella pacifica]|uniref:Tetratricopeptide repeat protein n=1 Tax=Hyunsoonleella pacifica TaxID=1080224 RepID=A0A4Q9FN39_9FLAO|nr:sensor histidine kinase [Hyunsoonleella pacifica]TBN15650.1 tetratricopeptide repeat protein [Hyunsoonleella pacifica]GGD21558.1 two-component sensor histidine kinase [Hyunsoonleella pacifica]
MKLSFLYIFILFVFGFANCQEKSFDLIDSIQSHYLNKKNIQDSLIVAKAHFSIGEIYRKTIGQSDSAYIYYHTAEKIFRKLNKDLELGMTLYGIAVIQKNEKDYLGSEVTSIEVISLLESLDSSNKAKQYISYAYNNLGIVYDELEEYEESIKYYLIALDIKRGLSGNFKASIDNSLNNLAKTYRRSGKYDLAINEFEKILDNKDLINERPDFYALVLDNYAHTFFLSKKYDKLPGIYLRALRITESSSLSNYNSIIINQHLAEYYNNTGKKDSARYYAYKAKRISEKYHNDDLLKSLMLLSKIENGKKAAKHLRAYVKLSDSLQRAERKIRNKSARIRFETKQIEQENIRIARERMWLFITSSVLLVAGVLVYIIISQRAKNKELKFAKQQQEANEEIYNLMLGEHEKVEEARTIEKQRISQELHDGVLGRLFGTRLSLDSLNMNNTNEAIKTRGQYISELKTIEDDIRKVSHELNTDFVSGSGFIDLIKSLVETQTTVYKLSYTINHDDDINWDSVSNKSKIHIYRILQETLHNIHKHANAKHINIGIRLENDVICLKVEDDGSGFDVNKAKSGIGLKNMNARIKEVDGTIHIESQKNIGTTVSIKIPTQYL